MNWQDKKVLVTGAGGFIGSHLAERLVNLGAKVRALVHYNSRNDWGLLELLPKEITDQLEVVAGDITNAFCAQAITEGRSIVYNMAALLGIPYSYVAPYQYVNVNIVGALNLLEGARQNGVELFIQPSTGEIYGEAQYVPIDENHPLRAQSPYAATKIAADKLVESYHLSFGLPTVILRFLNMYGPRQSARAIIPTIISQALVNDILHLGSLDPRRDFTYIDDTIEGLLKVAATPKAVGQEIQLASGRPTSVGEIADLVIGILNNGTKNIIIDDERIRPGKSEVWHLEGANRKAQEVLGWQPQISLEEGLRRTVDFIAAHQKRYKPEIYNI
jgi:NAD dependent epimerase/dehydratase